MVYISTRDAQKEVMSSQAILGGISPEGGLYTPKTIPKVSLEQLKAFSELDYCGIAEEILSLYLSDFSREELSACIEKAYGGEKFDTENKVSLSRLNPQLYLLELWHGPTCAFKDMALQILPQLMAVSAGKGNKAKTETVILVATSGDTGKAALEGFRDMDGIRMMVFYPEQGVSPMQKLQMQTQEGNNVQVAAIQGNFDDAQSAVKAVFTDEGLRQALAEHNIAFSSANSINWGRLVPQIVYYFAAYSELLRDEEIKLGEKINIAVPTGNFGNILAAYYAKEMGLPIHKLICASNENDVLTDFLATGCYDRNRAFHATISPSMDILISSNLERLLFDLYGQDDKAIASLMAQLKETGSYKVSPEVLEKIKGQFVGGRCDETSTKNTIQDIFEQYGYLCDTHTAVGVRVYQDYQQSTGDTTKTIVASTASPYKFPQSVLEALEKAVPEDAFDAMEALYQTSRCPIPESLCGLKEKKIRFDEIIQKDSIAEYVRTALLEE